MKVACAFDHAGFPLKALVVDTVAAEGHEVIDLGTWSADPSGRRTWLRGTAYGRGPAGLLDVPVRVA